MLINQQTFDLKSSITDNWGGKHRLVLDLKALANADNWELGISLPEEYKVKEIYGAKLDYRNGQAFLSGKNWNQNLDRGQKSQIVLIVDEGKSGALAPIKPQFFFAEPVNNSGFENNQEYKIDFTSSITDDWGGKHRAVLDLEALSTAKNWQAELSLPNNYEVKEIYGGKLTNRNGKTYLSGKNWNKNLQQGQKSQIVLIVDEGDSSSQKPIKPNLSFENLNNNLENNMLSNNSNNKNNFSLNSTITDDWGGSHRVVLDLEALSTAKNWQAGLDLADGYEIKEIYGGKLSYQDGNAYVSGEDWNKSLKQGEKAEVVLIVEEGKNANSAPIEPQLIGGDTLISSAPPTPTQSAQPESKPSQSGSELSFDSDIAQDWQGGYKLEVDIKAQGNANDWQADFQLPYEITAAYGVDLVDNGNGSYTISGQNDQANLTKGQSIQPVFIIDDGGNAALEPTFDAGGSVVSSTPAPQPEVSQPEAPQPKQNASQDTVVEADSNGSIIKVDDFGGNLGQAIAAAQDGDVVQFSGNKTYYTYGVTIDKDITLDGQPGTVIDGGGTESPIIRLGYNADGTTIQDLEITNGNVGITANGATNLLLQNLNVNNIGISKTIRDGQNNIGINVDNGEGLVLRDSEIHNVGRKGVSVGDTDGAVISNLDIHHVNLDAQHAQSHDAAGIKFFNTNDVLLKDSTFSKINAFNIWNDTTSNVTMDNNVITNVGDSFKKPSFNGNVDIGGIYNEKSYKSVVTNNKTTSYGDFDGFKATEYTTKTMEMYGNDFSKFELGTTDYWVNQSAEIKIAETLNPSAADFSLFSTEYNNQLNNGA